LILALLAASVVSGSSAGGATSVSHWRRPIEAATGSMGAASLRPEACAVCHEDKYADWGGARHSRSVGPGLIFQLDPAADPESYLNCLYCHAPLSSQSEVVVPDAAAGQDFRNPSYDAQLMRSGVSCAVCHVRGGVVYGPVKTAPPGPTGHPTTQDRDFADAAFCAACHQLDEGYGLSGRPLVNTYREWRKSGYADRGITCQGCHMPGRRHLFRGIHDRATTAAGVSIRAERRAGGAFLEIENTDTGHMFPTYVTPLVVIRGFQAGTRGEELEGTAKESYIGRRVSLDLSKELFDTRLAPGGSVELFYDIKPVKGAGAIVFEVVVYPDEFYERFYEEALKSEPAQEKMREIKRALKDARASSYVLFRRKFLLAGEAAIN